MTALCTESLEQRVERLAGEHSDDWPPLHSGTTQATIAAIIGRIVGLECAIHELAREVEKHQSEH